MEEKKVVPTKSKRSRKQARNQQKKGLTEKQVKEKREKYGYNELKATKKKKYNTKIFRTNLKTFQ